MNNTFLECFTSRLNYGALAAVAVVLLCFHSLSRPGITASDPALAAQVAELQNMVLKQAAELNKLRNRHDNTQTFESSPNGSRDDTTLQPTKQRISVSGSAFTLKDNNEVAHKDGSKKISPSSTSTVCPKSQTTNDFRNITFLVQNPRTGSLFMSGRLQKYGSGKYQYQWKRTKEMIPRPTASLEDWLHHVCNKIPGYKVIVYDSGASPNWWLSHWPANTALIMTGDEMGRWGLKYRGRYWGPFGDGDRTKEVFFETNESSPHQHILLPPTIRPWFRQYFDPKQQEAFGGNVLFMPLGSRVEFPDISAEQMVHASKRRYIYCLMAAATDNTRKALLTTLKSTSLIPQSKGYLHMAEQWHPEVTNDEYVKPEEYAKIMLDSTFAPCPKGRSLDTFRIYEAIEAGAIPVIELADGYARDHLPAEFFESGILFVEKWEDAPKAMMDLYSDDAKLNERQKQLFQWYRSFMSSVALSLENIVTSRPQL